MTSSYEATRPVVYFGERKPSGSEDAKHIKRLAENNSTTPARIREQQRCRDYWSKCYGSDAEIRSRGGVTWLR